MKKSIILLFAAVLLVFCGCSGKKNEEVIPDVNQQLDSNQDTQEEIQHVAETGLLPNNAAILGVKLSGMTVEDAYNEFTNYVEAYSINLTVNDKAFTISAKDLGMFVNEIKLKNIIDEIADNSIPADEELQQLISFNTEKVLELVHKGFDADPKNANIKYSTEGSSFVINPEEFGAEIDTAYVDEMLKAAASELASELKVDATISQVKPEIAQSDAKTKSAVEKANKMLSVALKYTYTPDGGSTKTEVMSRSVIGSLLYVKEDGLTVAINTSQLNKYVDKMDAAYSVPAEKGKFKTSGGSYLNISVDYGGQKIDKSGLYNDISKCISQCISGTRTAPYLAKDPISDYSYGGNYVEIDLSSQHLWVYKKGVCVVSSSIVSGSVIDNNMTPTGVYSVQNKATNTYLVGPTWKDWVYFWMPFYGGYGMHDADGWRSEYGGDIYLRNGSHGCVNMPYSAARDTYNNVSVGTKVILYGGAQSVETVAQSISGTTAYTVASDSAPFTIDAAAKYTGSQLKYTSSDTSVAEVNSSGVVTVKSTGTCIITVEAPAFDKYTSASMSVNITVVSPCSQGRHTVGEWETTVTPTCTESGERVKRCSVCGEIVEREVLPATGHSFSSGGQYCENGCGTENPEYGA